MRAGPLRHRITLEIPATGQDETGQPVAGWTDFATVWADVRFLSGLEAVQSDAPVSVARASVRIRYRAGLAANMRFQHDGRVFDVRSVLPDTSGRRYLDLVCETGANQG